MNVSSPPPAAGDDDRFDPGDAADLLVSTRRAARRSFDQTPIGYLFAAIVVGGAYTAYRRATRGVSGRSRREDAIRGLAIGIPWIAVYVFNGALKADGFGPALVYGVFDAAAPWLVVGTAFAALSAGRERWWEMGQGFAVLAIGTTAFFGPAGVWGVLSVAGFVGLVVLVSKYVHLRRP